MNVIITGGTGLIGRALSTNLASDGHKVIVLSRSPGRAQGLPSSVQVHRWDGRSAQGWGHLAEGADAIVNLAGANISGDGLFPSRWTAERKRLIRDSRLNAGQAVVEAVQQASRKPAVVVQASGISVYGSRGDEIVAEQDLFGDDFLARLASQEWEPSTAPVEELGVRRVVVRTGVVLSRQEGALRPMAFQFRLFAGGPIGGGKQWMSWIHLQDEAAAIRFLIENPSARGAFNLVAPQPVVNAEFARTLGRVMHRPSLLPVPGFAMKLAFGEVADLLLTGQRAVPQRLLDLGYRFRFPQLEQALQNTLL